jgi:hypothetical protein
MTPHNLTTETAKLSTFDVVVFSTNDITELSQSQVFLTIAFIGNVVELPTVDTEPTAFYIAQAHPL